MDKELDLRRYSRAIPVTGAEGQRRLAEASVLVVGCGALGSVAAMYLCGAGVGRMIIADFDTVDVSNLHRQVMYDTVRQGVKKCLELRQRMLALNPEVEVRAVDAYVGEPEARDLVQEVDFVIDASDNAKTKRMLSRVCRELERPCVCAGVEGGGGQVMTYLPGHKAWSEVFALSEEEAAAQERPAGVLGTVPAVMGAIEATEAIKYITGLGDLLVDRLLVYDALAMTFTTLSL